MINETHILITQNSDLKLKSFLNYKNGVFVIRKKNRVKTKIKRNCILSRKIYINQITALCCTKRNFKKFHLKFKSMKREKNVFNIRAISLPLTYLLK